MANLKSIGTLKKSKRAWTYPQNTSLLIPVKNFASLSLKSWADIAGNGSVCVAVDIGFIVLP